MKMRYLPICFIILFLLILTGYGTNYLLNSSFLKTTYVHHFPEKQSPALTKFMNKYILLSSVRKLFKEDNNFIFVDENGRTDDKSILYYEYTEEQVEKYYEPILGTDEKLNKILKSLRSIDKVEKELLKPLENPLTYSLPIVTMEEHNQLRVKTTLNETVLDLPKLMKEYEVKETDKLVFNLLENNKENFVLEIADYDRKDSKGEILFLTVFIKKDLSEITISEWFDEAVQKKLDTGDLNPFLEDFQKVGALGKYAFLDGRTIIDIKTKKIVKINEKDYLSNDGEYIYINGRKDVLEDGIQKIQTIDNYIAQNEVYEIEYKLDYKKIAKELDFATSGFGIKSGIGLAAINYFNENYIVLSLTYKGRVVGTAGSINVLIDFQKNKQKPTFYLVDLGIASISRIR
ncbi:hypothetical protein [Metabacillus fastidiosus]|uniref:hypothetical protein n=3 Tax=Metabacillus fastidiosus TaxID=1458 RepID=UPI003D281715